MKALTIARMQGAQAWVLRASVSLARLWWRAGRAGDARGLLEPLCVLDRGSGADLRAATALLHEIGPPSSGAPLLAHPGSHHA